MKLKHMQMRMSQCLALALQSPCPRRSYGAIAVDPNHNVVISEGWNGSPRSAPGAFCAGDVCEREGVPSGTRYELGCIHAEANVVSNAARIGRSLHGCYLFVTGVPCMGCARLLYQAGVARVITIQGGFAGASGAEFLQRLGVVVETIEMPDDPLLALQHSLAKRAAEEIEKSEKYPTEHHQRWHHEDMARTLTGVAGYISTLVVQWKDPGGR